MFPWTQPPKADSQEDEETPIGPPWAQHLEADIPWNTEGELQDQLEPWLYDEQYFLNASLHLAFYAACAGKALGLLPAPAPAPEEDTRWECSDDILRCTFLHKMGTRYGSLIW